MPPKAIPLGPNGFLEAIRNSTEAIVDMMARMAIVDQKLDAFRVSINDDGTFNIVDFTMPSLGDKLRKNVPQEDVPQWVMQAVSMLRIADEGSLVKGIGFKVSDRLYYIQDQGETDGQS
jgi:hypothetical protein